MKLAAKNRLQATLVTAGPVEKKFLNELAKTMPGKITKELGTAGSYSGNSFDLAKLKALMTSQGFESQGKDLFPMVEEGQKFYFICKGKAGREIFGVFEVSNDGTFDFEFSGY